MTKKLLTLFLSGVIAASLVSCSNKEEKNVQQDTSKPKVEERNLEGYWAKDYTKDELTELNNKVIKNIEDLPQVWDLDYKKEETVKDENGETVKNNNIHFENLNPEPNKIEAMYYGFKIYGSDMSSGNLEMKISFNLGRDKIKEQGSFNIEDTSLSDFSKCFTEVEDRDYSDLNSKISDVVMNNKSEAKIEDEVNGLVETIIIKDNMLVYKLETKQYNFKANKPS